MAERTGLPDPAPNRVSQAKTQPTHRTITHTGAQVKHSLRRGRFWIKEAPSRAAAAITAEMVRMATHSRGRRVPRRLLMKSARIFTRMVQVPWNFTGIIKMRIPTAEGIRNMARFDFCLTGMGHLRDGGSGMGDVRPSRTAVRGFAAHSIPRRRTLCKPSGRVREWGIFVLCLLPRCARGCLHKESVV